MTPSNVAVPVPTTHLDQSPLSDITSSNFLNYNLFNYTLNFINTLFFYMHFSVRYIVLLKPNTSHFKHS